MLEGKHEALRRAVSAAKMLIEADAEYHTAVDLEEQQEALAVIEIAFRRFERAIESYKQS